MNNKIIKIIRGGKSAPMLLSNGDKYDSVLSVYDGVGKEICNCQYVNTDFTVEYKGGILPEGIWKGIVGKWKKTKAIYLYNSKFDYCIKSLDSLEDKKFVTLPSLISNPNHNKQKIITCVMIHCGGITWDGSHGCITILPVNYQSFLDCFVENEKVCVNIIRDKRWIQP